MDRRIDFPPRGFYNWGSMRRLGSLIDPALRAAGAASVNFYEVPRNHAAAGDLLDEVARGNDAAIVGLAN
jgi:hypothetical protein